MAVHNCTSDVLLRWVVHRVTMSRPLLRRPPGELSTDCCYAILLARTVIILLLLGAMRAKRVWGGWRFWVRWTRRVLLVRVGGCGWFFCFVINLLSVISILVIVYHMNWKRRNKGMSSTPCLGRRTHTWWIGAWPLFCCRAHYQWRVQVWFSTVESRPLMVIVSVITKWSTGSLKRVHRPFWCRMWSLADVLATLLTPGGAET